MTRLSADHILLGTVVFLTGLGILILAGTSAPLSLERFGNPTFYLFHQIGYGMVPGILAAAFMFFMPLTFLRRNALIILVGSIALLALVFFPFADALVKGGASRWVDFGVFSFQPSEFAKLGFLLYLAAWASSRLTTKDKKRAIGGNTKDILNNAWNSGFLPFFIIISVIAVLLILQPDISTLGVIVFAGIVVYFSARTPWWHLPVFVATGIAALILLIQIASYRMERLLVFFNPDTDPMGIGYQLKQSLITIGSGGLTGSGLAMDYQQMSFLPAVMSDSIFAAFAQGTGFVGAALLVALFVIFLWRGLAIAGNARDPFSQYLAVGITSWITFQAFLNMGAMVGLVPLTGIPLPFISYGGSHLIAELAGVGILLNISRQTT